jgi:uncharacterized protein YpmB
MVRSRLEEWREEHHRKKVRLTIIAAVAAFLLVVFLLIRWYVSIHDAFWDERSMAVKEAVYAAQLVDVLEVDSFNGESVWFVIYGVDETGAGRYAWVSEEETIVRDSRDGISREEAERIVRERYPDITIIRTTPAVWRQELCYEIYYKVKGPDGDISYYDYIRFEDGQWIETLRLGK